MSVSKKHINIVWFRRDLRLDDNEAVAQACSDLASETVFVFCVDPWFFAQPEIGWSRVRFLFESLIALDKKLKILGSRLIILEGKTDISLPVFMSSLQTQGYTTSLYFNHDVQVKYGIERDKSIVSWCRDHAVPVTQGLNNFLLFEYAQMPQWRMQYYKYLSLLQHDISNATLQSQTFDISQKHTTADELWERFIPQHATDFSPLFTGGEDVATKVLDSFLQTRAQGYHWKLSRPYLAQLGSTSQLSAHLAFGTISVRSVYQATKLRQKEVRKNDPKFAFSLSAFLDRLRWKDSFTQRLFFNPDLMWKNRHSEFNQIYLDEPLIGEKIEYFERWKRGDTGFAMVDASMRQLNTQGYINFRMRAMCATFLCINCGISWHHGARYFMQKLIDGDIAINHWQWQMQSGVTNPLSKTFRIYDPEVNLVKKDPDLQFIHFWCPEYRTANTPTEVLWTQNPMLNFQESKKKYGTVISQIRKTVRERLMSEKGFEYGQAAAINTAVKMYQKSSKKRYAAAQSPPSFDLFEEKANA